MSSVKTCSPIRMIFLLKSPFLNSDNFSRFEIGGVNQCVIPSRLPHLAGILQKPAPEFVKHLGVKNDLATLRIWTDGGIFYSLRFGARVFF